MKKKIKKLRKGDVYHFQWSREEYNNEKWGGALRHCFEGLLNVMDYPFMNEKTKKYEDKLMLVDTFWGVNRIDNNKRFTLEEIQKRGTLTYYCNTNELEKVESYNLDEYKDEDLFQLHDQHSCVDSCVYWYKRKGAKKSPDKKIATLEQKIQEKRSKLESLVGSIQCDTREIEKVKYEGLKS